jgi:hypothetical protein
MPLDQDSARHADLWAFAAHWTGLEIDLVEGEEIEF